MFTLVYKYLLVFSLFFIDLHKKKTICHFAHRAHHMRIKILSIIHVYTYNVTCSYAWRPVVVVVCVGVYASDKRPSVRCQNNNFVNVPLYPQLFVVLRSSATRDRNGLRDAVSEKRVNNRRDTFLTGFDETRTADTYIDATRWPILCYADNTTRYCYYGCVIGRESQSIFVTSSNRNVQNETLMTGPEIKYNSIRLKVSRLKNHPVNIYSVT